jgi:hypothetical protein
MLVAVAGWFVRNVGVKTCSTNVGIKEKSFYAS